MFSTMIHVLGSMIIGIIFGTYIMQWLALIFDILDNRIENRRQILWKVIPGGFILLVVWRWQELGKGEIINVRNKN